MIEFMEQRLPASTTLTEAVRYAVNSEGKRIRPLLAYATAEVLNIDASVADHPAAAIELLHTYSLVHDDLPAMDDDDLRRGRPTVHKVYDEATGVLVGDALLTHSFDLLVSSPVDAEIRSAWVTHLAQRAGVGGMIQGQSTDLEGESRTLTLEELEMMHRQKSGALIEASLTLIAMLARDENIEAVLSRFAHHIGLAFQIKDDILDVEAATETLGKPALSDQGNQKSTFVSLLGIDESRERMECELQAAFAALDTFHNATPLRWIADYIVKRNY